MLHSMILLSGRDPTALDSTWGTGLDMVDAVDTVDVGSIHGRGKHVGPRHV